MAKERGQAHPEAVRFLRQFGLAWKTVQDARRFEGGIVKPPPNRWDITAIINGQACFVEVKAGQTSLPFDKITEGQKSWADTWVYGLTYNAIKYPQYRPAYTKGWLWVCLGTDPPHVTPGKKKPGTARTVYKPRITWLIEWPAWKIVEAAIDKKSISYAGLLEHAAQYQLTWEGKGQWAMPTTHPFYSCYLTTELISAA